MQRTRAYFQEILMNCPVERGISLDECVMYYQDTEDPRYLMHVFLKYFPFTVTVADKYFGLTEDDKASYAVEELSRAMIHFEPDQGTKIQTLYAKFLSNRYRYETQQLNTQKRKANSEANSSQYDEEVFPVILTRTDKAYRDIEFEQSLKKCESLTENEKRYCNIVMNEPEGISDSDIARDLGVTPAAVYYIKQSLQKKLSGVFAM